MNQQETILHYLNKKDSEKLKELVSGMEELPLLQLFSNLSADEKVIVFRLLPKDKALILFEDLTQCHPTNTCTLSFSPMNGQPEFVRTKWHQMSVYGF